MKKQIKQIFLLLLLSLCLDVMAEGTKELTPIQDENASLYLSPNRGWGPSFNSTEDDQLRFYIHDHTLENFYFGAQFRIRGSASLLTDVYYRILDSNDNVVSGPTLFTNSGAGYIDSFAQAVSGPQIGSVNPNGYVPFVFNPTSNGEYHIEVYRSNNSGSSQTTNSAYIANFFDFTVATNSGTILPGRVYCLAWSILATTATDNYQGEFIQPINPTFYAYTPDSTVVKVSFDKFNPLAAIIGFNFFGVDASQSDWSIGRQSAYSDTSGPNLSNGYYTFLNIPDSTVFPFSTPYGAPTIDSSVTGCPGNYQIHYTTAATGDVFINIDLNGIPGYQIGSSDRQLLAQNVPAGSGMISWDGLDGLGNAVAPGAIISIATVLRRGRVNLPIYDAEWNINGFTLTSEKPIFKSNLVMYWDDSQLTSVGAANNQSANITGAGIDNSIVGQSSPGHAWNGAYGNTLVNPPAPANSGGNATPQNAWDDFGNVRTLNTWFFGFDTTSALASINMSPCAPLPISYMRLSVKRSEKKNILLFETQRENNTDNFLIEISYDGVVFKDLYQLKASGNTDVRKTYKQNVEKETKDVFYRVMVTDLDGHQYVSNTVFVPYRYNKNNISIYPNPTQGNVFLQFDDMIGFYILRLYNVQGNLVRESKVDVRGQSERHLLKRNGLTQGVYHLNLLNVDTKEELHKSLIFD